MLTGGGGAQAHDETVLASLRTDTRLRELIALVDGKEGLAKVTALNELMAHTPQFTAFVEECLRVVRA